MDIYASDEEKGEEIKQWWRDNGTSVIAAIILALAVLLGGRYWLNQQQVHITNASSHYMLLKNLLLESQFEQAESEADIIFRDFPKTSYATFSAFELAKYNADKGDYETSKFYLKWVIENGQLPVQVETARLRLAQLLLNEGQYQLALDQIDLSQLESFSSLFNELKGDIYLAQGSTQQAEQAYQSVLSALQADDPRYVIVKLKLDDVSGA